MPFEHLAARLGAIPEFHPIIPPAPPVVNTSGMVEKMTNNIEKLVNYWSPFEQEKRKMEMRALKVRKFVFDDYEKHPDQYEILPNGSFRKKDNILHAYKVQQQALSLMRQDQAIQSQRNKIESQNFFNRMRQMASSNNSAPLPSTPSTDELDDPFYASSAENTEDPLY